jgi:hypothetical protein
MGWLSKWVDEITNKKDRRGDLFYFSSYHWVNFGWQYSTPNRRLLGCLSNTFQISLMSFLLFDRS